MVDQCLSFNKKSCTYFVFCGLVQDRQILGKIASIGALFSTKLLVTCKVRFPATQLLATSGATVNSLIDLSLFQKTKIIVWYI